MPPKKAQGPSKKAEAKRKEKVVEDKTFGLKNKKGAKNQKFIQQVQKQVQQGGDPKARRMEELRLAEKKKKEDEKKRLEEEKKLFAPVVAGGRAQTVEAGVDPKSIFCAFFKQGLCKKGAKCKFSHDPSVERKAAKKNIYSDARDDGKQEGMDDWDEDTLNDVINKRHGSEKSNATDIICKYFLDAVENNKYGWFWQCPNGNASCHYRHALPPGFVLKKDKKARDAEKATEETSLEELIEEKRAQLSSRADLTKVSLETFVQWKKRKLREKADAERKEKDKRKDKYKAGLTVGLSGREMFTFDPKMAGAQGDDDEEGGDFDLSKMEREEEEDDGVKVHEIKFDEFGIMEDGLDESTATQLAKLNGGASGLDAAAAVQSGAIDENLFEDEDLDELEEDMNGLEV